MQFNDTTTNLGVIQNCERMTGLGRAAISGDPDLLADFTAYSNIVLSRLWHSIFKSSGSWEYDDSNQTDLPQAVADITIGTSKYALPTGALAIKRVEIKNENDEWTPLTPLLREEIKVAIDEHYQDNGTPTQYRLVGDTIELFPASDYNKTGGLKVYFDRGAVSFSSSDTTQEPGFAEYHDLVPLGASLEWLDINLPEDARTKKTQDKYILRLAQLEEYYQKRFPAKKKIMRRRHENFV